MDGLLQVVHVRPALEPDGVALVHEGEHQLVALEGAGLRRHVDYQPGGPLDLGHFVHDLWPGPADHLYVAARWSGLPLRFASAQLLRGVSLVTLLAPLLIGLPGRFGWEVVLAVSRRSFSLPVLLPTGSTLALLIGVGLRGESALFLGGSVR